MATRRRRNSSREEDDKVVSKLRHYDTFYGKAPPGYIKGKMERPEDSIPDCPENRQAREFLSKAPTKGLWMPLGKEVKVMQCWRCKAYGHRTGDRECPMFRKGNTVIEQFRVTHEDPMHDYIIKNRLKKKEARIKELQALLDSSTTDSDGSDLGISSDHRQRRKRRKHHESVKTHSKQQKRTSKHKKESRSRQKHRHEGKRKSKHRRKHKHKDG